MADINYIIYINLINLINHVNRINYIYSINLFEAAQKEENFNQRLLYISALVQSVRYKTIPEEGLQGVIADIVRA